MDIVTEFRELVDRPSDEVDLGRAALTFAAAIAPEFDAEACLAELDHLADGVRDFAGLRQRLFAEQRFTGDAEEYDAPVNSLLHRVLQRRRGIPISLSVVAIEVGRRAGVPVEGIGAPGHFLVRDPASGALCDPFHDGALVDAREVARHLAAHAELGPALLPVVDAHQILIRMLGNLAGSCRRRGLLDDLEWVLRCQAAVPGSRTRAALELAEVLSARGAFREAAVELRAAAAHLPDEEDAAVLIGESRALLSRLN